MSTETRTVHVKLDPAMAAYLACLEAAGTSFSPRGYDLFAKGYRARVAEERARPESPAVAGCAAR